MPRLRFFFGGQINRCIRGSKSRKMRRARSFLNEAKRLAKSFPQKLYTAVYEEVVNCSGRPLKSSSCGLGGEGNIAALTQGESFCLSQARECGVKVSSCYEEVKKKTEEFELLRDRQARYYNQKIEEIEKQQQFYLDQLKLRVGTLASQVNTYLPNTQIQWPNDLIIKKPSLERDVLDEELGVTLKGNVGRAFLSELPQKIEVLVREMGRQKNKSMGVMKEYVAKQKSGIQEERSRWKRLKETCEKRWGDYHQGLAKQREVQSQTLGEVNSFCLQYDFLRANPAAGCDSLEELMSDSLAIANYLNPQLISDLGAFKNFCHSANNEELSRDEEGVREDPLSAFTQNCQDNGNNWNASFEAIKNKAKEAIPFSSSPEEKEAMEKLIDGTMEESDLGTDLIQIKESSFYKKIIRSIIQSHQLIKNGGINVSSIVDVSTDHPWVASKLEEYGGLRENDHVANLCQVLDYTQTRRSVNYCLGFYPDDVLKRDHCYEEKIENPRREIEELTLIGMSLTNMDEFARNQLSHQLGELLSETPCSAIPLNGHREVGSDHQLENLDAAILDGSRIQTR